jgi:hypothetical protein
MVYSISYSSVVFDSESLDRRERSLDKGRASTKEEGSKSTRQRRGFQASPGSVLTGIRLLELDGLGAWCPFGHSCDFG